MTDNEHKTDTKSQNAGLGQLLVACPLLSRLKKKVRTIIRLPIAMETMLVLALVPKLKGISILVTCPTGHAKPH